MAGCHIGLQALSLSSLSPILAPSRFSCASPSSSWSLDLLRGRRAEEEGMVVAEMEADGPWADLAPELLANVVKRVQSRTDKDKKESRRGVAMAGVCRSWRQQVLLMDAAAEGSDEVGNRPMQFPGAVVRPPRLRSHVQCLLKRRGNLFFLFQTTPGAEEGSIHTHFLLAARRRWLPTGFSYVIGLDPRNVWTKQAPGVLGKLKSNFWASEFVLWEKGEDGDEGEEDTKDTTPVVSLRFVEHLVNGIRQRRIWCSLPPPAFKGLGLTCVLDKRRTGSLKSLLSSPCLSWSTGCVTGSGSSVVKRPGAGSRLRMRQTGDSSSTTNIAAAVGERRQEEEVLHQQQEQLLGLETMDEALELRSKVPAWDAQQQCWSLDFKGRATMPSMHNFQLIRAEEQQEQPDRQDQQVSGNIVLQLGKIGKKSYTMDFGYPLSAFQAFAICLSSFATSAGLEP